MNKILLLLLTLSLTLPTASFAWHDYANDDGGWDYYGSGRDHPYSVYIDRRNRLGDENVPLNGYLNGPLVISNSTVSPVIKPQQFRVNVPNAHGGYNQVIITRDGDGFRGPFGEYYPEFPKVFQLQMKYSN